jgi:hypothetical protein
MTTTTANKTQGTALLALTQQASATVTVGSAIDVSTKFAARYFVKMGRTIATALSWEVLFRLDASAKSSGNDEWYPLYIWSSQYGKTTCNATTLSGATTAGNTTSVLASGTGITGGDVLYFRETGTPANSEWSRVKSISSATPTFEDAQTRNHTNGITVTDFAEMFSGDIDLSNVGRIRLVVDSASNASGQTVDVIGWLVSLDSVSTV